MTNTQCQSKKIFEEEYFVHKFEKKANGTNCATFMIQMLFRGNSLFPLESGSFRPPERLLLQNKLSFIAFPCKTIASQVFTFSSVLSWCTHGNNISRPWCSRVEEFSHFGEILEEDCLIKWICPIRYSTFSPISCIIQANQLQPLNTHFVCNSSSIILTLLFPPLAASWA